MFKCGKKLKKTKGACSCPISMTHTNTHTQTQKNKNVMHTFLNFLWNQKAPLKRHLSLSNNCNSQQQNLVKDLSKLKTLKYLQISILVSKKSCVYLLSAALCRLISIPGPML